MPINLDPAAWPMTIDDAGTVRMRGSRVPFDRVVECYRAGDTPEQIVDSFDTLQLADVYLAIAYYLLHTPAVEEYLRARQIEATEVARLLEARQGPRRPNLREELVSRLNGRVGAHAEISNGR